MRMARKEYASAISPRDAPELCEGSPSNRGSGECRVRAAPAVSCAKLCEECAHEHTGSAETLRHPPRNGFTAYAVLSSATNSSCHRHRRIEGFVTPGWVDVASADLTPATGARTTRFCRTLQRRSSVAPVVRSQTQSLPCESKARPTLPRPPHPIPTFVTMANAPREGRDSGSCNADLGQSRSRIFLREGLDRPMA
jgi:hypothetical protein